MYGVPAPIDLWTLSYGKFHRHTVITKGRVGHLDVRSPYFELAEENGRVVLFGVPEISHELSQFLGKRVEVVGVVRDLLADQGTCLFRMQQVPQSICDDPELPPRRTSRPTAARGRRCRSRSGRSTTSPRSTESPESMGSRPRWAGVPARRCGCGDGLAGPTWRACWRAAHRNRTHGSCAATTAPCGWWASRRGIPFEERPRPDFVAVPMGERGPAGTWPGRSQTIRDDLRQTTRVEWSGTSDSESPWGRVFDRERLTYEVDDARPEAAAVRGEAETDVHLPGRILSWKARLDLFSDREQFHYRLRRELHENGRLIRERTWEETIPRDYQ